MTSVLDTTAIEVAPVAGQIGAEIRGIDLADDHDDHAIAEIRDALLRHRVLFFRDQHLDHEAQVRFGRRFGDLTYSHPFDDAPPDGTPEIYTVDTARFRDLVDPEELDELRNRRRVPFGGWHSDVTPAINPPYASILRADVVPAVGGDTTWTNLVAAYDALSEPIKQLVDGLRAEHRYGVGYGGTSAKYRQRIDANPLVSHHPVVRVHPETGEKALLVSPGFTSHIVGLNPSESRRILDLLFEEITRPEHTVRFRWEPGSVAFWDNRTTSHLAPLDLAPDTPRRLFRVTLVGDVPVGPDGRSSDAIEGGQFGEGWTVS